MFNNRVLYVLDGDRKLNNAEHAGTFAWSRTDPSCKLWKIIGFHQPVISFMPETFINVVIPFRNKIVNRATACHAAQHKAGMTVRRTAIHTASTLFLQISFRHLLMELLPIFYSLQRCPVCRQRSLVLHKTFNFAHINSLIFSKQGCTALFRSQFPETRAGSWTFFSNDAITASSPVIPAASTSAIASRALR